MRHGKFRAYLGMFLVMALALTSHAQLLFSRSTDTIAIQGGPALSTQVTLEAIIDLNSTSYVGSLYPGGFQSSGIFNSFAFAEEDVHLGIGNGGVVKGDLFDVSPFDYGAGSLTTGNWYDISYVFNGSQESIYVNGVLQASASTNGAPATITDPLSAIGAIDRNDVGLIGSFQGQILSLRVSNTARYTGPSYTATLNDFPDDSSTQMLYDFDLLLPGATTITDLSGNGHDGTLGSGFVGATSPAVVPEPAYPVVLIFVAGIFICRRRAAVRIRA